jgi:hypothetical protein
MKLDESVEIQNEQKRTRRSSIIREFCLNTSTHGLPGIARSQSRHNCLFWSISLLMFTGLMICLVASSIQAYLDYPTQMDLEITTEWPQYFPAFSFCNVGRFRLDRVIEPFLNFTNKFNMTGTNDTTTITEEQVNYLDHFIRDRINQNESLDLFFFPLSSMLYKCMYNNRPCTSSDFISFTEANFGLCHTFNAKLKNRSDDSIRYGNENGGNGILELGLYVHSHQYIPYIIDST